MELARSCFLPEYIGHVSLMFLCWRYPKDIPLLGSGAGGEHERRTFPGFAMSSTLTRSKRQRPDDHYESDFNSPSRTPNFSRFLVIQAAEKDKSITSLSPFVIEKTISSILGTPKSIKNLRNGNLLVEVSKQQQAENLLGISVFYKQKVNVFAHPTLNSSRGVVRCPELSRTPLDEVKEKMKSEGVTDVKRITIKKNGQEILTNTYIFTFDSPRLPDEVKIAYHVKKVEVFVPNPLQCFRCQKFGHHEDGCKAQEAVCGRCAGTGHNFKDCTSETRKCANCQQEHNSNSRACSFWQKEKEILRIKHTESVSFFEARSIFERRQQIAELNNSNSSYANVVKPKKQECKQCEVLVNKLCILFPDKADEIRKLVQSPDDSPASASIPVSPKTLDENRKSNVKTQEQTKPAAKVKNTPKGKISLDEKSINRQTQVDSTKSTDKKKKIKNGYVVEDNNVALQPIPTSSNQYQVLSDMEEDNNEDEGSSEDNENT